MSSNNDFWFVVLGHEASPEFDGVGPAVLVGPYPGRVEARDADVPVGMHVLGVVPAVPPGMLVALAPLHNDERRIRHLDHLGHEPAPLLTYDQLRENMTRPGDVLTVTYHMTTFQEGDRIPRAMLAAAHPQECGALAAERGVRCHLRAGHPGNHLAATVDDERAGRPIVALRIWPALHAHNGVGTQVRMSSEWLNSCSVGDRGAIGRGGIGVGATRCVHKSPQGKRCNRRTPHEVQHVVIETERGLGVGPVVAAVFPVEPGDFDEAPTITRETWETVKAGDLVPQAHLWLSYPRCLSVEPESTTMCSRENGHTHAHVKAQHHGDVSAEGDALVRVMSIWTNEKRK